MEDQIFICFAAEDRYDIVEPIVYHLKNYGVDIWYDRYALLLGDNRIVKNFDEGVSKCKYVVAILSKHTVDSACAMEELSIIETRYYRGEVTVFPILFELAPNDIPHKLQWVTNIIFKEVDRNSGTREICNHIVCKITTDIKAECSFQSIDDIIRISPSVLPPATYELIKKYQDIDSANLNSRITMLYAAYLTFINSNQFLPVCNIAVEMISKIFNRLFSETRLSLAVDYRELWLLENSICILTDYYIASCTESKI